MITHALPAWFNLRHLPATIHEVRSWSFGQVKRARSLSAQTWQERQDTLDCERTFGPLKDHECVCGKYKGRRYRGMICDTCGVNVTARSSRRQRFGHIELETPLRNVVFPDAPLIEALPVLLADFRESIAGEALDPLYERLLQATCQEAQAIYEQVIDVLLPAVLSASAWDLPDADVLARGLALTTLS